MQPKPVLTKSDGPGLGASFRRLGDELPSLRGIRGLPVMLLVFFVTAVDSAFVNTVLPQITSVSEFDTNRLWLPWIPSVFMIGIASISLSMGGLFDRFGSILLVRSGLVILAMGAATAASAHSLVVLLIGRWIEGCGAGITTTVCFAYTAALVHSSVRGRCQTAFGFVYGVAVVAGPLLATGMTSVSGWRSVFWLEAMLAACCLFVISKHHLTATANSIRRIDGSMQLIVCLAITVITLWASPLIDRTRPLGIAVIIAVLLGVIGFALARVYQASHGYAGRQTVSVPVLLAGVILLVASASLYAPVTGLAMLMTQSQGYASSTVMTVLSGCGFGFVAGSMICGWFIRRNGNRVSIGAGLLAMCGGLRLLAWAMVPLSPGWAGIAMAVIGAGFGIVATAAMVLAQDLAPQGLIGTYVSFVNLVRNFGGAIAINLFSNTFAQPVIEDGAKISLLIGWIGLASASALVLCALLPGSAERSHLSAELNTTEAL